MNRTAVKSSDHKRHGARLANPEAHIITSNTPAFCVALCVREQTCVCVSVGLCVFVMCAFAG